MKRFLVVEDEPMSLRILLDFLSDFAECDGAANGRIAFEMFEKAFVDGRPYHLVCSDVVMPEMDGHHLTRKIRDSEASLPIQDCHRTVIFMISASGSPGDMTCALLDNDCDDYVVKPFHREQVIALLQKYDLIPPKEVI